MDERVVEPKEVPVTSFGEQLRQALRAATNWGTEAGTPTNPKGDSCVGVHAVAD